MCENDASWANVSVCIRERIFKFINFQITPMIMKRFYKNTIFNIIKLASAIFCLYITSINHCI